MTPVSGIAALGAAFVAGLTLTVVAVDPFGNAGQNAQRVETAAPHATESSSTSTIWPGADEPEEPTLLVVGETGDDSSPPSITNQVGDGLEVDVATTNASSSETTQSGGDEPSDASTSTSLPQPAVAGADGSADTSGTQTPSPASSTQSPADTAADATQAPATAAPTTATPTTAAPTTETPTTAAPTTETPTTVAETPAGSGGSFEGIRNNNPLFNRYENVPSNQLSLDALTEPASPPDNGAHPDGNFRMACQYSHFSNDDPIVFPGEPGRSHLHMFFGNTSVDAYTDTNSLVNSGGSSCNGFELNRSGYWTPAVLDGAGNAVVPDQIILYYKTKDPSTVQAMPQGLKMIAGNTNSESFTADYKLGWSCGASGTSYNRSNRIPNNCGSDPVNAYIQFPFCWDGQNLDSADHISHMAYINDNQSCPSSHPVRLPQISILLYFPAGDTSGWYLSSDRTGGFNTGPGATLHADWFGGWNDEAMDLWINGCMTRARNCSFGQTGTSRMFQRLNPLQDYPGNNFLPLP